MTLLAKSCGEGDADATNLRRMIVQAMLDDPSERPSDATIATSRATLHRIAQRCTATHAGLGNPLPEMARKQNMALMFCRLRMYAGRSSGNALRTRSL